MHVVLINLLVVSINQADCSTSLDVSTLEIPTTLEKLNDWKTPPSYALIGNLICSSSFPKRPDCNLS